MIAARTAGEVTGAVVWNTTWALSPDCDGNLCCRSCWARADSVDPPPNLLMKMPGKTKLRAVTTTSAASQTNRTRRRLR